MRNRSLKSIWAMLALAPLLLGAAESDESRTLNGHYMSGFQTREQPLEAIFTPDGEDEWTVEFHFRWDGRTKIYKGTAKGSLTEGGLQGRVQNESRQRTFTFRGEFRDGVFEGQHYEISRRGNSRRTGTLDLR